MLKRRYDRGVQPCSIKLKQHDHVHALDDRGSQLSSHGGTTWEAQRVNFLDKEPDSNLIFSIKVRLEHGILFVRLILFDAINRINSRMICSWKGNKSMEPKRVLSVGN